MLGALVWFALGALAVLAGTAVRRRVRELRGSRTPTLDDEAVRRILEAGTLTVEDEPPLDLDEIEEAEDRFWSERWDEPEERGW